MTQVASSQDLTKVAQSTQSDMNSTQTVLNGAFQQAFQNMGAPRIERFETGKPRGVSTTLTPQDILKLFYLDPEFVDYIIKTTNLRFDIYNKKVLKMLEQGRTTMAYQS
ncbi:hypothetical protein DFA_08041 [Cavenderia fasciculata]|uniref:Uncharacterized protein n=1 Tax=Cavenderia fasciculata TaxID=261658 RepID=F4Q4Q1_CACFS|nr:uncharacterized protein DFA_08041 [Cavenderia fasciculata]EGG17060.1 hypothetical protein DFA_08041 [Cavenderia fasciculata]|eukprot:XP_004355544.1 hypothetical protein DFA_08041 [Cavenderia fasciculata]